MKPRKLMMTIEMLTDIPTKEFTKAGIQTLFYDEFLQDDEVLTIHQVRTQIVKEDK
ncbi:MAG: hypothetical protein IMZ43_09630 [Thermoplasmata archaeon]|nr:hypothetical protein [Thermoplasmata archaeon]